MWNVRARRCPGVLLLLCACSGDPSPWARARPREDRPAWEGRGGEGATRALAADPALEAGSTSWIGASGGDLLGGALGGGGDLDADGYDDIALGEPGLGAGDGGVEIFLGAPGGPGAVSDLELSASGGAGFGGAVAIDGDLDADGTDDLAVGAPDETVTATADGQVYVFLGSTISLLGGETLTLSGSGGASAGFGAALDIVGDVDGDGYDDLLVGEPGADDGAGRAWIVAGGTAGPSDATRQALSGSARALRFGAAVSGGGDATGDGLADFAVGAPGVGSGSADDDGEVDVYQGDADLFDGPPSALLTYRISDSGAAHMQFGASVALEQSLDADGWADLLIGARTAGGGRAGRVFVYRSTGKALPSSPTAGVDGPEALSGFGAAVAALGDVDGDGLGDFGAGAPFYASNEGYVALLRGSSTSSESPPIWTTLEGATSGELGLALSAAGDVNADGYDDVLVGAPEEADGAGTAYLYLGGQDQDGDGYLANGPGAMQDCDDTDALVHPGATESCDDADTDEDCDGLADDDDPDATGLSSWYADEDGDGYGTGAALFSACDAATGYAPADGDCDDGDPDLSPGASEVCDEANVDEDCDGVADDADSSTIEKRKWYHDIDGDTWGVADDWIRACDRPSGGYVHDVGDCDDTSGLIHPGGTERCDSADVDEDCDGLSDDDDPGVIGKSTWYADADDDGYGDAATTRSACDAPTSYVANRNDCDDGSSAINPDAAELCDGADVDEDCDGLSDDRDPSAAGETTWYLDHDHDGYGDAGSTISACDAPPGYDDDALDCDDDATGVSPSALERCDDSDIDEDCDGLADDGDPDVLDTTKRTWFGDADLDGWGDPAVTTRACDAPTGFTSGTGDCDDGAAEINPDAAEICDDGDVDEDCDGLADDADPSASGQTTWYADADADDHGDPATTIEACDLVSGYVSASDDCDDGAPLIHPGADESDCADPTDYNCDGSTGYADADADGWAACEDCDDASAEVYPGASESVGDGVDEDCDTEELCWVDADMDGYTDARDAAVISSDADCADPGEADADTLADDCDDGDATVYPDAPEACDGEDQDCDGSVDEALPTSTWYADADMDGYGDPAQPESGCAQPQGSADNAEDCDDGDALSHPGATEILDDGVDEDCDGADATSAGGDSADTGGGGDSDDTGAPAETGDSGEPASQDTDPGGPAPKEDGGCGCASASPRGGSAALLALLGGLALARRRRRG